MPLTDRNDPFRPRLATDPALKPEEDPPTDTEDAWEMPVQLRVRPLSALAAKDGTRRDLVMFGLLVGDSGDASRLELDLAADTGVVVAVVEVAVVVEVLMVFVVVDEEVLVSNPAERLASTNARADTPNDPRRRRDGRT